MKTTGTFKFGEFRVDALARTLQRNQETVTLNRRAFDVLLYFVQNPGRVLTREELLKNVWAESFVDENSLAQSISALRRALEEKPGDNSYVVTLPGRGYQFVSAVQAVAAENEDIVSPVATAASHGPSGLIFQGHTIRTSVITEEKQQLSLPAPGSRAAWKVVAAITVVVASVAGYYAWTQLHRVQSQTDPTAMRSTASARGARRSIAVLGFRNLSGRPQEDWLSTALAEMLSTELVTGERLRLVSGEDIGRAKLDLPLADADSLSRGTLARLHKDLDSDLLVLGSYTAVGEKSDIRIRLDLRLQDTAAGETIADVAVVGSEANLFDLASEAGSRLRERLGLEAVSPVEAVSVRASLPSNREAARLYSEGLARLRVLDALEARDLLQRAVAADSKFSLAHSALAEAWSRLGYDKKAQPEAQQAYELSTNLPREERLAVEGRYRDIDHEYEKAIDVYRTLFTLFPDNFQYGLDLAAVQVRGGKGQEALATVELLRKAVPPPSEEPMIELQEAAAWEALGDFKHQEEPLARAAEKARAQGSRLLLAQALEDECWMFHHSGQLQKSVAACQESRDIYAAAGDRDGEARSLGAWADAIFKTDAPQSIRLYKQAQEIFRKVGSERSAAKVLNNLGEVYEAQGDVATAEKMFREALASWKLLDNKRYQAAAIGNIANDRKEQGDLRGAAQLYEETLQLAREAADTGIASLAGDGLADLHLLQGDLAGARQGYEQSIATSQKNGDQISSGYPMTSLGDLLLLEADFAGARKTYEQALAIRTSAGDTLTIAETQLGLAELSLEEARSPTEQEAATRRALEVFQEQQSRDDETDAWRILARALGAEGKGTTAKEAMQHARSLAAKSQNPKIRWQTAIAAARIEAGEKDVGHSAAGIATRKELAAIIAKARELGYRGIELEARLTLAEIEMSVGQIAAGRAHLIAIETDAKAKSYNLVARKAAMARSM
jgi:DNA-binding winged helix-turn-helix (wHTH) protein/Tfp pilus assembly protein PilF/TolB-like protein